MASVRGHRAYDLVIPAGEERTIHRTGEFFYVLECDLTSFKMGVDDGALDFAKVRTKSRLQAGEKYDRLRVGNPNGAPLTVKIIAGFGDYGDDEVQIGGSIDVATLPDVVVANAGTHTPGTDLAILTGVAGLIAAAATRKEILISADGELRLSDVTGKGFVWDGSSLVLTTKAQIDFFNDTVSTVNVQFTELLT